MNFLSYSFFISSLYFFLQFFTAYVIIELGNIHNHIFYLFILNSKYFSVQKNYEHTEKTTYITVMFLTYLPSNHEIPNDKNVCVLQYIV